MGLGGLVSCWFHTVHSQEFPPHSQIRLEIVQGQHNNVGNGGYALFVTAYIGGRHIQQPAQIGLGQAVGLSVYSQFVAGHGVGFFGGNENEAYQMGSRFSFGGSSVTISGVILIPAAVNFKAVPASKGHTCFLVSSIKSLLGKELNGGMLKGLGVYPVQQNP